MSVFQLNAQKKEIVDTDALIERYRKEIEDLKARLLEKEAAVDDRRQSSTASVKRRLSVKEVTWGLRSFFLSLLMILFDRRLTNRKP